LWIYDAGDRDTNGGNNKGFEMGNVMIGRRDFGVICI
jgi:hypothetical protein